ncbi:MAG: hypothetical protein JST59_17760 [Actinobacteria bacterium]|nr:hypothetical protein [Actinomycetota bacterium]
MARPRRATTAGVVLMVVATVALVAIPAAIAAFGSRTQNEGDLVTAAPDFVAPAITASVVAKSQGGTVGYVRKGGTYFVYANVSADTGNPASGLATVKTNVAEVTTGASEATLTAATNTVGGVTYNYRSAELTATTTVEGSRGYSVTATDNAGNANTVNGSVTLDNVVPTATDVQSANGGTTVGRPEEKDSITFTFSEPIEPQSILGGWTGASTNVVVRMVDNGILGLPTGNDELFVYNPANTEKLPFGTVNLGGGEYVAGALGGAINFGASGTKSTMVMSGNTVKVTFGTQGTEGILVGPSTTGSATTMAWSPVATPYDRAANVMSTAAASESGGARKNF